MRRAIRAAAMAAAALILCAGAGTAFAQQSNAAAAAATTAPLSGPLSGQSLGLDQTADPQAPVVTHAIAPSVPQSVLDAPPPQQDESEARPEAGRSLADLVEDYAAADVADEETDCLARAVYWESKGEPLAGQLAVADVIINRAQSGRFASTLCGVVRQRSQFSFVHGGYIPPAPQGSAQWRTAVAIARIARGNLAADAAPQALFFHARYVHPGWRLTRVASVGNHVFYR